MRPILLFTFALAWGSTSVRAALEFSGYMRSTDHIQFVITDLSTGEKSKWLKLGGTFLGHKLTEFDAERQVLVVEHAGQTVRLRLKDSRVKEGKQNPPLILPAAVTSSAIPPSEIKVELPRSGVVIFEGEEISLWLFERVLRYYARRNTPLTIHLHLPPGSSRQIEGTEFHRAIGRSGINQLTIKMVSPPASPPE